MIFARQRENRRKTTAPRWQWPQVDLRRAGIGTAMCALVATLVWGMAYALDRPVERVVVEGRFQRVSAVEVEQAIEPFAARGFLSVELADVRGALERIEWVDRAQVERSWPDGLRVTITEHVAAARWGDDGLLNTRGELFLRGVRHLPPELPQLSGPEGSEDEVARLYLDTYPRLLAVGLQLMRVELDPRGAWQLTLANGVVVRLGRQDVEQRLERFIAVASPLVATRSQEISYIDLRYSNGFSVGWNGAAGPVGNARDSAVRSARRQEVLKPDA